MDLSFYLPRALTATGPRGLPWWMWMALPVVALLAVLLGMVFGRITQLLLRLVARRTRYTWDDGLIEALGAPLTLLWAVAAAFVMVGEVGLPDKTLDVINRGLRTTALL